MPDVTPDPNQQQQQQSSMDQTQSPTAFNQPQAAQPATPAAQPQQNAVQQNPSASQPQVQPHPVSRVFDGILKTMTGGPVMYTDANGERREAPQSRGTLAKSIVAAALAGLLTPDRYRQGAFGSQVRDMGATAGDAAKNAGAVINAARQQPQQISDDEQAKRLFTLTSNANLVKNMAASTLQNHAGLQTMVDSSAPLLKSIKDYEGVKTAEQPNALIAEGLTKEEAEAKMQGHFTEWKAIPTGTVSVLNPETHQNEDHPLYSIVNPTVKVPLNEEAVNILATVNPSFKGAWQATNGNVTVPLSVAVSTQHLVNQAHIVQAFADSRDLKTAFPDRKQSDIAAALRGPNGKQLITALDATRDSLAAGAPTYRTLDAMRMAPNGRQLLEVMGLSPDSVDEYITKKANADLEAKKQAASEGTAKGKAMFTPITATTAPSVLADPNSTPARRTQAQAVLDIANAQKYRLTQQEQALRTGTPEQAGQLLANGDLTLTELKSRGSTPDFIVKATQAANKIDPMYNAQKADAEYKIAGNQQNTTFFGSAKSLTDPNGTLDQLASAYEELPNGQLPLLNKWEDYLSYQEGDPAMAGFLQTAIGVADDYAKVMGGGTGSDTSRLQVLKTFANAHNPQQMAAAIQAARNAVNSQVNSRLGSNRILRRMYGDELSTGFQQRQKTSSQTSSQPQGIQVKDPRGVVHTFPNQAAADQFKKLAGIQ